MMQVVQAKCPHCQNVLRIPADWLAKPMRCKFCKQVIQAKANGAATTAAAPAAAPAQVKNRQPAPAATPARRGGGVFSFEDDQDPTPAPVRRPPKRGKGGLVALLGVVGLVVLAALVFFFAGDRIRSLMQGDVDVAEGNGSDPDNGGRNSGKRKGPGPDSKGAFPRRALLINVNNYWLLNQVHYGTPQSVGYPGSSTAVLASRLAGAPMYFAATQVTEVSDGAPLKPITPSKFVIENAISDFANTSRPQDRVLILFAGHATDIDKEAYLIPFEGNKEDAKTLVPLSWVYEQLAKCKARQKILVLDVFRFPPARGLELPGTGEMTEDFDAKVAAPPPGVQVWTSCVKEQRSIEFDGGSLFLQSLCHALQERFSGFAQAEEAIPVEALFAKVNQRMKDFLAKTEFKQESRLAGAEASGGAAYDPTEPSPPRLVLREPPPPMGDDKAGAALVNNILDEMRKIPPMKPSLKTYMTNMRADTLPPFSRKIMDFYSADYMTWGELENKVKGEPGKYPLRAAVLDAKKVLEKSEELNMLETLSGPYPIPEKVKAQFLNDQKEPGKLIYEMETVLDAMKEAEEKRSDEVSKRWQAQFDYAKARLMARLIYINEYNYILGDIRGDRLPALEGENSGWRLGFKENLSTNEKKVKTMAKDMERLWRKIAKDHPGTPWALLAQRESLYAVGLQWRASRE
jgi:hypothetical protein